MFLGVNLPGLTADVRCHTVKYHVKVAYYYQLRAKKCSIIAQHPVILPRTPLCLSRSSATPSYQVCLSVCVQCRTRLLEKKLNNVRVAIFHGYVKCRLAFGLPY